MLSPADYAAYSRATGRSYPQSEEEKAAMYGDVRNFRNEQTKSNDVANLAGGVLLGAGVLGAGVGGAMALRDAGRLIPGEVVYRQGLTHKQTKFPGVLLLLSA